MRRSLSFSNIGVASELGEEYRVGQINRREFNEQLGSISPLELIDDSRSYPFLSSSEESILLRKSKATINTQRYRTTFGEYLKHEFFGQEIPKGSLYKRLSFRNFFRVPFELELLLFYGFWVCLESFLFIFTILPIRFVISLFKAVTKKKLSPVYKFDFFRGLIFIVSIFLLSKFDLSYIYHSIRVQTSFKLYFIFKSLFILEKLCSGFGRDVFNELFLVCHSTSEERFGSFNLFWTVLITIIYLFIHSFILYVEAITLNVSINAFSYSLLTFLVTNNFIELKSHVFKKVTPSQMQKITYADAVERFHNYLFLLVVNLNNFRDLSWRFDAELLYSISRPIFWVCLSEILADWVKHTFIIKFNNIDIKFYRNSLISISKIIQNPSINQTPDCSYSISKEIGFLPYPIGFMVCRVCLKSSPLPVGLLIAWTALVWIILFLIKLSTSFILLTLSKKVLDSCENKDHSFFIEDYRKVY